MSGELATGKSSITKILHQRYEFKILSSKDPIIKEAAKSRKKGDKREVYQHVGNKLDKETNGEWLVNFFQEELIQHDRIVIDAVRIKPQIDAFRSRYGNSVIHIHLTGDSEELKQRFLKRDENLTEEDYKKYKSDPTEKKVNNLNTNADLVINTSSIYSEDATLLIANKLDLLSRLDSRNVDVVIGAQFGSEGKGQIAAYLSRDYDCLIRVGGPNAGHKVYHELNGNPAPHTFHIIPSGSVANRKAKIVIGPGAVINRDIILNEIQRFEIEDYRLFIDPNATIISTRDRATERLLDKIGSTAQGVGAATACNIMNRLKADSGNKAKYSNELKQYIRPSREIIESMCSKGNKILLEGTQGTHLSLHHGLYPHVTSRDTTVSGCLAEAGIAPTRVRKIVLVTRRYPIRVQNPDDENTSGDFLSNELSLNDISNRSGIEIEELERTERTSTTDRKRRIAEFSWSLFRQSCELNCPTDIAFTFSDYIDVANRDARRFDQLTTETIEFISSMEDFAHTPVSLIATRFDYRAIIDRRRNW